MVYIHFFLFTIFSFFDSVTILLESSFKTRLLEVIGILFIIYNSLFWILLSILSLLLISIFIDSLFVIIWLLLVLNIASLFSISLIIFLFSKLFNFFLSRSLFTIISEDIFLWLLWKNSLLFDFDKEL